MKKRILMLLVMLGLIISLSGCIGFDCYEMETVFVPPVRYSTVIVPYRETRPYVRHYRREVPPAPIRRNPPVRSGRR